MGGLSISGEALTSPALLSQPSARPSGERREKKQEKADEDSAFFPFFPLSPGGAGGGLGEGSG
jgi:hypothetical protein